MLYKSYLFVDKDPIIDQMRTAWQDAGSPKFTHIERDGGPTATCINNWFNGDTRRPQFASVAAFFRAIGVDLFTMKAEPHRSLIASDVEFAKAKVEEERLLVKRQKERTERLGRQKFIKGRRAPSREQLKKLPRLKAAAFK